MSSWDRGEFFFFFSKVSLLGMGQYGLGYTLQFLPGVPGGLGW